MVNPHDTQLGDAIFILRRTDGGPVGEFMHWVMPDGDDWTPQEEDDPDIEYEMLTCHVTKREVRGGE